MTGFGLAGHLLELCRGANLKANIEFSALPIIPEALEYAKAEIVTGASRRNWTGYSGEVSLPGPIPLWQKNILTDPQTSGGLLISCDSGISTQVIQLLNEMGFTQANIIGQFSQGQGLSVSE